MKCLSRMTGNGHPDKEHRDRLPVLGRESGREARDLSDHLPQKELVMNGIDRITNWINIILQEMSKLDADKGVEILNACGKECSKASAFLEGARKIQNQHQDEDLDNIFNAFKEQYYNTSRFEKDGNKVTLIFEKCTCPMVKQGVSKSFLCNCTVGYSINIFKTLFNRPVKVKLLKSILNGDDICKQEISIEVI
ncbi:hypothetical protein GF406_01200 [candidate division KSB1 bacterium]|nr:hypothetical protein [candidate division KSB1 bacterium]